jgi:hypothetical protein
MQLRIYMTHAHSEKSQLLINVVSSLHNMKANTGGRGIAPLIPHYGTRSRWVSNFTLWAFEAQDRTPVHTEEEAPGPVWAFLRRQKFLAPIRMPHHHYTNCDTITDVTHYKLYKSSVWVWWETALWYASLLFFYTAAWYKNSHTL